MRAFFNGLILGLILGILGGWMGYRHWHQRPGATPAAPAVSDAPAGGMLDAAGDTLARAGESLRAQMERWELNADQIREELASTGRVVRDRSREIASQAAGAVSDARITAEIKARLLADKELSARTISVAVDEGRVGLAGTVRSEEQIGRAVALALGVNGVRHVTASLQAVGDEEK
jgi:hyperosmotically inducible protein